jgi:hypothetical protein
MHRHQAKRKRGGVQKQRAEAAYEHVKACQQHACNKFNGNNIQIIIK